jgi:hypothetical protein
LRHETQRSSLTNVDAAFPNPADTPTTCEEKIKKIFEAWDIHELVDMQVLAARAEIVRAMKLAQDDLAQRYGDTLSNDTVAKLAVLHNDRAKSMADVLLSAEQLTDWYTSAYTREMSDDDLDYVLGHYSSPIGQKMVQAERKAIAYATGEMLFQKKLRGDPMFTAFCSEVQRVIFEQNEE